MIESFMISCGFVSLLLFGGFIVTGHPEIAILVGYIFVVIHFAKVIRQNKDAYLAKMFVVCLTLALVPLYMKHIAVPFATMIVPLENADHIDFTGLIQIFTYLIEIIGIGFILYYGYLFVKFISRKKKANLMRILSENGLIPNIGESYQET